jgi:hypothetical protein
MALGFNRRTMLLRISISDQPSDFKSFTTAGSPISSLLEYRSEIEVTSFRKDELAFGMLMFVFHP